MIEVARQSKAMDVFRDRVREELSKRGLSISWLATESGVSRPHVSRVLSGIVDATIPCAEQIAEALELPLAKLLSEKKSAVA